MDFKTKLQLDGSDFGKTLDDAQKQVNDFAKSTSTASKEVDDMGKTTKRTASELLKEMKAMEGGARSVSNYRSQLSQMTRQLSDLTINYRAMSDEMKNSDFGREVASQIQELTKKASEYKDAINDATQATRLLASDTANLDAAKSALEGLSAGMQLFASAGILGEENTEKVVKALAKLKAIESATNAVIKIANILNKDSILILKIKTIQTNLATKATVAQTAATKGATVAQRVFNTVAKANPYVLLATAILTVVGALVAFTRGTEEDTEAQEKHQKQLEEQERRYREYADSLGSTITKYRQLQIAWKELNDAASKQNFIKEHKKDFDDLGISISNVDDAEKVLVKNTETVMKVFALRAKAAAAASLATQAYTAALMKEQQTLNNPKKTFNENDRIPENMYSDYKTERAQRQGLSKNIRGDWYFTAEGARQASEFNKTLDGVNQKYAEGDKWLEKQNEFLKEAQRLWESINVTVNNNPTTPTSTHSASAPEPRKQLETIQLPKRQEQFIIPAKVQVEELYFPEANMQAFNNTISDAISGFQSLNSAVSTVGKSVSDLASGWDESKTPIENITTKVGDMLTIMQTICSVMDTMNKLGAIFETLQELIWKHKQNQNAEEAAGMALKGASAALASEEATANIAGAAGGIAESASKIPYVGWAIALAAIASFIGLIASLPKFAQGGIVPGNSFSGDNITAQLNSGEMVLNTSQQARLFDLLNGEGSLSSGSNKVEFVIKGQELKGVLNNYDKKMSRI